MPMTHLPALLRRCGAATIAAVTASLGVAAAWAPVAHAAPAPCPAAVMIVARGSGQTSIGPQTYPGGAHSDGWEGDVITSLLRKLNLSDTAIMTLNNVDYPALIPDIDTATTLTPSVIQSARNGVAKAIRYEDATGCHPDYILVGYSQGAAVTRAMEKPLYTTGRLRGVVYLGDALLRPGDPSIIGTRSGGYGLFLLPGVSGSSEDFTVPVDRVEYCLPYDPVCDSAVTPPRNLGHVHGSYFLGLPRDARTDRAVIDRVNAMLAGARNDAAHPDPHRRPFDMSLKLFLGIR